MGVEATFADPGVYAGRADGISENTKAVFGETIANPGLVVLDLKNSQMPHMHMGCRLLWIIHLVTPINCRPFEWGADW